MRSTCVGLAVAAAIVTLAGGAQATTVFGTDDIYKPAGASDGTLPPSISVSGGDSLTFGVTGTVTLNNGSGTNPNDPDGVGAAPSTSSNTGAGSFSGIVAPKAGYLVGVFVALGGPSGPAPATLDYTGAGAESAASYSPLLDQVFFIGDGLTGNGTGSTQTFIAPTGAVLLYLGISDACGYNGGPSCYSQDNSGSFSVSISGSSAATPLPAALPMFVGGLGALGVLGWRKKRKPAAAA
jgi:hypothetical protein